MRTAQRDSAEATQTVGVTVSAAGAITGGTGCVVTKAGTGVYTVRFFNFRALTHAEASIVSGGGFIAVTLAQPNAVQVNTWGTNTAAADIGFTLSVTGLR